ncbi:MAG TPA: alpha/beta hydrolase [Cytophaga sp.]|jgi:pimeloyl-ACP methyl ester carboxylesterase|nr:alpha/beta hydrolase [Cytophaga sp.]
MTLYFLSGLGADKSVFQKLKLPHQYKIVHIDWIRPEPKESIASYAHRLAALINQQESFAIIGLSFGGIVASELSKIVAPVCTIIISSISTSKQLPTHFSALKYLHLHKFIPARFLKIKSPLVYWFMGVKTLREKVMFNQILQNTDIVFFRWAVSKIIYWHHPVQIKNIYHIHGSTDNIFPIKNITADHTIQSGGHLMVYSAAKEVSSVIKHVLER